MNGFYRTCLEEQETLINIDYYGREVVVYTSNSTTYSKLIKKIEYEPKKFITKGKISGAEWRIPFSDRKTITSILSRPLLIGNRK